MPQTMRLRSGYGAKASEIDHMLHPSSLIREKWTNTWQRERVTGVVLVGKYFRVVRRGSPATNAFIMCHEDFLNKKIYATKRMLHTIEEVPKEDFIDLERPYLDVSIASAAESP